jgi:CRP/FNR family cyclic AMP-dependent transcriptional regulator
MTDGRFLTLLEQIAVGKKIVKVAKGKKIFAQGEEADAIYFIASGKIKLSVLGVSGKEAVLWMLKSPSFFGEGCLTGLSLRLGSATALEPSSVFRVERRVMLKALHEVPGLAEKFTTALLARNTDLEEDLCDQLFNHSEKRLARVLLKLSRMHQNSLEPDAPIPVISHETLAEMVGTTRSRITHFMNKFRKMGLIDYNGVLTIHTEPLTNVVLRDQDRDVEADENPRGVRQVPNNTPHR